MINYSDTLEDTRQRLGFDYLAVKTDSWHLMKAFKEAVEEMGWRYNHRFTQFTQENFDTRHHITENGCMYFSFDFDAMEGQPAFALSCTSLPHFELPREWNDALTAARKMLDANRHLYSVELNEDYNAVIDTKNRTVRVGCQEFPFSKVQEVAKIIRDSINKNK